MYSFMVLVFSLVMVYIVVPKYGRTNPTVYISICSLVGSVSVMAIKGLGVAVKLTFAGNNQFTRPATYLFGILVATCIIVQTNYLNKALDTFSTNVYVSCFYPLAHGTGLTSYIQGEPNVLRRLLHRDDRRLYHPFPGSQHG